MLFPNSEHFTESHFVPIIKVIRYNSGQRCKLSGFFMQELFKGY